MDYSKSIFLPLNDNDANEIKEVTFFNRKNSLVNEYASEPIPIYGGIMTPIVDGEENEIPPEPIAWLYSDGKIRNKFGNIIEEQSEEELYKPLHKILAEKKIEELWGERREDPTTESNEVVKYYDDVDKVIEAAELLEKAKPNINSAEYVSGITQEPRSTKSGSGDNNKLPLSE